MNINIVYANIRLAIAEATRAEVNKYIILALNEINARGLERVFNVSVTHPPEGYNTDIYARSDGQAFNYYPADKCLILPSSCLLVEKIYLGGVAIPAMTRDSFLLGALETQAYYLTDTGEMYFAEALDSGASIKIVGRAGGMTLDMLSDRYVPFITNAILAGLYSHEYKDADMYAVYSRKYEASRRNATYSNLVQNKLMIRNGRLY